MEFGTLGLGTPAVNSQSGGANPAQTATLETNPENVVTPSTQNDAAENDLRRDGAPTADNQPRTPTDEPASGRRTTLVFDSEQNRVFLAVVDTETNKVIERIPSEKLAALNEKASLPPQDTISQQSDRPVDTDA